MTLSQALAGAAGAAMLWGWLLLGMARARAARARARARYDTSYGQCGDYHCSQEFRFDTMTMAVNDRFDDTPNRRSVYRIRRRSNGPSWQAYSLPEKKWVALSVSLGDDAEVDVEAAYQRFLYKIDL